MTELEKCLAGEYYNCHDPVFLEMKGRARKLLQGYNMQTSSGKGHSAPVAGLHGRSCFHRPAVSLRLWEEYSHRQQRIGQYELYLCGLQRH